jgi:tetratricopeptide (TPR) repeat protein
LAINPIFEWALNGKGRVLINLGNYTGAITYLDKALAIDPKFEYALSNKALAQRLLEHPEVNHATTIKAPTNVSAQQMLPDIKYAL